MRKIILCSVIITGTLLFQSCSDDEMPNTYSDTEPVQENSFSLENFDDPFVKSNLNVDWGRFTSTEDGTGNEIREYSTWLNEAQVLDFGPTKITSKYTVLARKEKNSTVWDHSILRFMGEDAHQIQGASYFSIPKYSGVLFTYNLKGGILDLQVFDSGKTMAIYKDSKKGLITKTSKVPDVACVGPACDGSSNGGGRMVYRRVKKYTDYYNVRSNGRLEYNGSVYNGTRTEWVWVSSANSGYRGIPHYHSSASDGPSTSGYRHDREKIWDFKAIMEELSPDTPVTDMDKFLKCYDVSKSAKITVYADQPIKNSSLPATLDKNSKLDPGHAFVSISQNGNTSTFGFYPEGDGIKGISGPSIIGNNGGDPFDISASKTISGKTLKKILEKAKNYKSRYDLNLYNCTDYVRDLGNLAGMKIPSAWGPYPGVGNGGDNPGKLGEVLKSLEGKSGITINKKGGKAPSKGNGCN